MSSMHETAPIEVSKDMTSVRSLEISPAGSSSSSSAGLTDHTILEMAAETKSIGRSDSKKTIDVAITVESDLTSTPSIKRRKYPHVKPIFSWGRVGFSVQVQKKKNESRTLLKDNTGYVEGGQIISIMGGSGAGKSTLLNCLSGRVDGGRITG